ncbi:MAG: high frequency lysogenization protein HflD [Mariprofundaceae bacterium]|nr:high frequency lysogenization protein HflD [Mariprofundaceae bacterium]
MPETQHAHARVIALAALMQAAKSVDDIARKGICDAEDFHALLHSLFADGQQSPELIFGGRHRLKTGLTLAKHLLSGEKIEQAKTAMSYTAGMMAVEKRLRKQPDMLQTIANSMARIEKQREYFGSISHESVVGAIADVYGDTISTLKPRIIVHGKPELLRQSINTNKVRALLFSGVRAAHLWQKHKGGHFRLLFGRKRLLHDIEQALS